MGDIRTKDKPVGSGKKNRLIIFASIIAIILINIYLIFLYRFFSMLIKI